MKQIRVTAVVLIGGLLVFVMLYAFFWFAVGMFAHPNDIATWRAGCLVFMLGYLNNLLFNWAGIYTLKFEINDKAFEWK